MTVMGAADDRGAMRSDGHASDAAVSAVEGGRDPLGGGTRGVESVPTS